MNQPIEAWLKRHAIRAEDLWPGIASDQRTLWNARLFSATDKRDAANVPLRMANGRSTPARQDAWRKSERFSMAMILENADPPALIEHREIVAAYLQTTALLDIIRGRRDTPVEAVLGHYSTAAAYDAAERLLTQWAAPVAADANMAIDHARARWCCVQLLQRPDHPDASSARARIQPMMRAAFEKVAHASELGHREIHVIDAADKKLRPGIQIVATAPVRIDLAGGWTDTPPFCFERGGHVVNVAIDLDARPPVRATVQTLREPRLILESADLGQRVDLMDEASGFDPAIAPDMRDPFALHKVALALVGILPGAAADLRGHLKSIGVGFHITTECRVPKGSGLGTSSILSATLLAALHRARGQLASREQLVEQTLLLEQRLSTGGGWQDQVGGIVGGVKSIVTAPGVPQRPVIETLALSDAQLDGLQDRLVVYFSGQQRLARDILRRVMGRWLGREPAAVALTEQLKQSSATLRAALLKSQWNTVGKEIARYWRIKKELYPGSATSSIDVLFLDLADLYLAAGLSGAGGGGFAYFFCKDAKQAGRLRHALSDRAARPGSLGTVYDTRINRTGIELCRTGDISVL